MTQQEAPVTERTPLHLVSFIVPTHNEATMLPRLLNSIQDLEKSTFLETLEIVVVDAASTDGTPQIAQAAGCILLDVAPGSIASSRNLGAARASGAVLAFVDADCELPVDWLKAIGGELSKPGIAAVGSSMALGSADRSWVETSWFALAHHPVHAEEIESVEWLASFNIVMRKNTFEAAGGFDESLETGEDAELSYRLARQGSLRRLNNSRVIHHGESKTIGEFYRREGWRARSSTKLAMKHWRQTGELLSVIIPVMVIGGLLLVALLCIASLTLASWALAIIALGCAAAALTPVVGMLTKKRVSFRQAPSCAALLLIYLAARCSGLWHAFERVDRVS